MTQRAKISSERRAMLHAAKGEPDAPCVGKKRTPAKSRPWVVEYCAQKGSRKDWFLFEHDGVWHQYCHSRYATEKAARAAMRTFRLQQESLTKLSKGTFARNLQWRVRNTED